MIIKYGAFANCTSLKEIHFEKCSEPNNTNIYRNTSDDFKIIVKDKLFEKSLDTEIHANFSKIIRYSDYIQQKIDKLENSKIILSIIQLKEVCFLLNQIEYIKVIKSIIQILIDKYKITESQIQYIKYLLEKKQDMQNES